MSDLEIYLDAMRWTLQGQVRRLLKKYPVDKSAEAWRQLDGTPIPSAQDQVPTPFRGAGMLGRPHRGA